MNSQIKRFYWQVTALLLVTHFSGWAWGMPLALALNTLQVTHFVWWHRGVKSLEVQVRIGYLCLLLLGHLPYMHPVHWVQFVGVNVMLIADYCLLARLITLFPWNRTARLNLALVKWVIFSSPAPGAINHRIPTHMQVSINGPCR